MTVIACLLWLLLAVSGSVAAVTYLLFYYEAANQPHPDFTAGCGRSPALCLVSGFVSSVASQIILIVTYPLGLLASANRPAAPPVPGKPAVVLVHGLYHNASAWIALAPLLRRAGFANVLTLSYNSFAGDFQTLASRLAADLALTVPMDTPLLFVGHSLGGLFIRRLTANPAVAERTRGIVTLGTPYQGSKLAALAVGRLGRGLMPGRGAMAATLALPETEGIPRLALKSPVDNMVLPLSGLAVDREGWIEEATVPVSHVAMLYTPAVLRRTVVFLRQAAAGER